MMNRLMQSTAAAAAGVLLASAVGCRSRGEGSPSASVSSISTVLPEARAQIRAAFVSARQAESHDPRYAVRRLGDSFDGTHAGMRMHVAWDQRGATLSPTDASWSATLHGTRVGCVGEPLHALPSAGPPLQAAAPHRIEYAGATPHPEVTEWYALGELGLEQGFTLSRSPCQGRGEGAPGDVLIEVALDGLDTALGSDGIVFQDASGVTRAHYTDLSAHDARGGPLAVGMGVAERTLVLRVAAGQAAFPVEVDPLVWMENTELLASDGAGGDRFGFSVSISGSTALVGAPYKTVAGNALAGAAYVFAQTGGVWAQVQELTPGDGQADAYFGTSVSISGSTALIGAPDKNVGANGAQGVAYIFTQSGSTWSQTAELTASDGAAANKFGTSVAVSGSIAAVGAIGKDIDYPGQGAVYAFIQSGTSWPQIQRLSVTASRSDDNFGNAVSVSGTTILVGAYHSGNTTLLNTGAAYVFEKIGTFWNSAIALVPATEATSQYYGTSVSISGTTAVVGAPGQKVGGSGSAEGAADVFTESGTTWTRVAELTASDHSPSAGFGTSVAAGPSMVLVGARGHSGGTSQGAFYVFTPAGSVWTQQDQILTPAANDDGFGQAVAFSGNVALLGAYATGGAQGTDEGAAYVYSYGQSNGGTCTIGSDCASAFCVGGICCSSGCGPCGACGTGSCTALAAGSPGNPACAPYVCDGSNIGCPTTCTTDAECIASDYCAAGVCAPKVGSGGTCATNTSCASGDCFGGFCCAAFCAGGPCGATACDNTGACVYPTSQCAAPSCTAGIQTSASNCSNGTCPAQTTMPCNPYVCGPTACLTSCVTDFDCIAGDGCDAGTCGPLSDGGSTGVDAGSGDSGVGDAGMPDGGAADAGEPDSGSAGMDAGRGEGDSGVEDAGRNLDAGAADGGIAADAGPGSGSDAGAEADAGEDGLSSKGCGCGAPGGEPFGLLMLGCVALAFARRRPRGMQGPKSGAGIATLMSWARTESFSE
jgi:hypothetical protein